MKTAFYMGMLGVAGGLLMLTALVPSARVTARPPSVAMDALDAKEERTQTWKVPAKLASTLRIKVQTGSIKVIAGQTDTFIIQAKRIVRAKNGTVARELLTKVPVDVETKKGELCVNDIRLPGELIGEKGDPRIELELDITAPAGVALEANIGAGNTRLLGRIGKIALQTQAGNVSLERQQGVSGEIAVGTGLVTLGGEIGSLTVQIRTGEVRAARVQAGRAETVAVSAGTGNIWLSLDKLPKRELTARTRNGDVVVKVPTMKGAPGPKLLALSGLGSARIDYGLTFRPIGSIRPTVQ